MIRRGMVNLLTAVALVAAQLAWSPAGATPTFDDVPAGAYYETAVEWLASTGITEGTSDTEFSPRRYVTRAQMAAFLARFGRFAADSPKAAFDDVVAGSFYDEPVDWLLEHAITTGTSDTTYSPGDYVTRAQLAAFLWRFVGRVPSNASLPFDDVAEGTWYAEAVAWMVENGITEGTTDTTYSPDDYVTRAQMATLLWRLAGSPDPGEPGFNRTASSPLASGGGLVKSGGVAATFDSLTTSGYVTVVVGEHGPSLAALSGVVSQDVEINISQAGIDGPIELTVPIDTVDVAAFDLVVNVVDQNGDWVTLAVPVTTQVVEGQMYATFTLPADVPLAPTVLTVTPLALFGVAQTSHSRIVVQVSAEAVAPPSTSPPPTTTEPPPAAPVIDLSGFGGDLVFGAPASRFVTASGGSGTYVALRHWGLPPGLSLAVQQLDPFVAELTGTPTEAGTFYVTVEVEDDTGAVGVELAPITVLPNAHEADFVAHPGSRSFFYPTVPPMAGT